MNAAHPSQRVAPGRSVERSADYTYEHLADKTRQSQFGLTGELKPVPVLSVDVRASMELAGQLDAEGWQRIPERIFEILMSVVHRVEGTVSDFFSVEPLTRQG